MTEIGSGSGEDTVTTRCDFQGWYDTERKSTAEMSDKEKTYQGRTRQIVDKSGRKTERWTKDMLLEFGAYDGQWEERCCVKVKLAAVEVLVLMASSWLAESCV